MADETENFVIKVVADVAQAGAAFDQLDKMVTQAASKAQQSLAQLANAVKASDDSFLKLAASATPLGRSALALVETLGKARDVARDVAKAFGADAQFEAFESSLNALGKSVGSTFDYLVGRAGEGEAALGRAAFGTMVHLGDAET